jgi:trehalose 6-phosphate phosphatase
MRALLRAVREHPALALFLDFDGTLVPIQSDPETVRLTPAQKKILGRIGRKFPTAVVSGRSLEDLRDRVDLPKIAYAGNHGLEIRHGRTLWSHPEAKKTVPVIKQALRETDWRLRGVPGILLDDKGLSASVHFRGARTVDVRKIVRTLREIAPTGPGRLKLTPGKKVMEIRPAVDWDKGRAVLCLLNRLDPGKKTTPLYLGDDRTDEDAFRALSGTGLTVRVGGPHPTAARFRIRNVAEVWRFLESLLLL